MSRPHASTARTLVAIALLWCAGLVGAAQFAKIAVPFAEMRALYPAAGAQAGWLLSIVSLIGAGLGVVAGRLAGRLRPARMLLGALAAAALLSGWQAIGPSFTALLVSRVIEGASHLAIVVTAPVLIAQIAPSRLVGVAMALWSTFFGVAFALTAWLGLPLVHLYGPGALFVAHAGAAFVVALALAPILGMTGTVERPSAAAQPTSAGRAGPFALHVHAYRTPRIAAPGVGWLFYTLTFLALLTLLPERLPTAQRAAVAGLMPLVCIAASLLAVPPLLRVMQATTIVISGFVVAALVLLGALFGLPLAPAALALFVALGLVQGASFVAAAALNASAEDRALAYGVMAQTGNIGNLIGTPLMLAVLGHGGEAAMFAVAIGLYLTAIAAQMILRSR